MARVFLSYDREDGAKARPIAQALERAGHFVWWDLHIKGGAEYGREIEVALEQSDAVVVLWSSRSINSAWVRDEAAAGRESGRLIPVLIEPVSPPMGFRQYQNLDFSARKGRRKPQHLAELLESIEALGEKSDATLRPVRTRGPPSSPKPSMSSLLKWSLIGGAVMIVLVALVFLLQRDRGRNEVHTVAVASADANARPLSRELLVNLGRLQSAKSGSIRLVNAAGQVGGKSDLIFEAASANDNGKPGASLVLLDGNDRSVLWSKDFTQESGSIADLKLQLAFTAARVLGCALEGLRYDGRSLGQQTLKLYLNACAELAERAGTDPRSLIPTLKKVTEVTPRFGPAWGKLLMVEAESAEGVGGEVADPLAIATLGDDIADARKFQPEIPEIKLAQLALLPMDAYAERMRLVDEANVDSRDNPVVLTIRSNGLRSIGRMDESVNDAKHAAELDPLSPATVNAYISALAYAGRIETAREELAKAERLWPGTASLADIQYRFHLRFGDPKEALRLGPQFGIQAGGRLFLKTRAEPTPANIEFLKQYAAKRTTDIAALSFTTQAFGQFNLNDELFRIVLPWRPGRELAVLGDIWFRPSLEGFRRDPRFMLVSKRMGLLDYWRKSGKWPDFCGDPVLPYDCKAEAAKLGS